MPKKTTPKKSPKAPADSKPAGRKPSGITGFRLRKVSAKAIVVKHLPQPPTFKKPKRIHARHVLPQIREGKERAFHSLTEAAPIRPLAMLGPMAATDELTVVTNTELTGPTQQDTASNVGEPSVAVNGNVVFFTGNWYAANSSDGGTTFQYVDPASSFPNPRPDSQFCCDQVVHYIPKIDTFVWLLQYGPESGDNIQRIAFAKTADVVSGKWMLFDITTASLNSSGAFLDFPDLAVGANYLYVTTNVFGPGPSTVGSAVVRIPLSTIWSGQPTAQHFVSTDLQSFRVAQNCGTTAYFAAHQDTSTLAVFSWDESQSAPVSTPVGVARWIGGNGYNSRTPDGRRWLDRADPRITGATLANNELWFAWSVDANSNHRPNPFVQIAKIDTSNLTLIDNINVFDADSATCYAGLNTNANNEVGISYMIGGNVEPSHVIGILTGTRKDVIVANGDRGPLDPTSGKGEWGDFLTVRRAYPSEQLFAAAGYTMKGPGDGTNRDATPHLVVFGRSGDTSVPSPPPVAGNGGANAHGKGGKGGKGGKVGKGGKGGKGGHVGAGGGAVSGPGGGAVGGPGGGAVGGPGAGSPGQPFTDVNALPTVSVQVATIIKAFAMSVGQQALPEGVGFTPLKLVTKPGVERWPVKTGIDPDNALVGKNIINGQSLGTGIVDTTVQELIRIPRSTDMTPAAQLFPAYQERRKGPVETTVWRLEADITALKQESDGDYHLVLQGASGETMVAEIPTPHPPFVDAASPWTANMQVVRQAIDDKLVSKLNPADFIQVDDMLVPRDSVTASTAAQQLAMPSLPASFRTPPEGSNQPMPAFKTQITPVRVRITGVGLFDKVHGQMGVALLNGVELHPILKIEWL